MLLRIRLAMKGLKNRKKFDIVVIACQKARNARPIEKLGEYDPIPKIPSTDAIPMPNRIFGKEHVAPPMEKKIEWDSDRIKYWLAQGAEPTDTVTKLFVKGGIIQRQSKEQARERRREKRVAAAIARRATQGSAGGATQSSVETLSTQTTLDGASGSQAQPSI